jgi:hypothetical protein
MMSLLEAIEYAADTRDRWIGQGRAGAAESWDWLPFEVDGTKIMVRTSEVAAITDQREEGDVTTELPSTATRSMIVDRDPGGRIAGVRPGRADSNATSQGNELPAAP